MNGMITFIIIIAAIVLVVQTVRWLRQQDPLDLFTGAFSILVIFGLFRLAAYMRQNG